MARSLDFVEIQNNEATAAVASIEDAAECDERADALVIGPAGPGDAAARHHRDGAGLRPGRWRGTRGRTAGSWRKGQVTGVRTGCRACWAGAGGGGRTCGICCPAWPRTSSAAIPATGSGRGWPFDETADLRKGNSAACVAPQHAGVTGKIENCVTWVFAALVTALRAGLGRLRRVHAGLLGEGPGDAGRRRGSRRAWRSPPSRSWPSRR